MKNIKKCYLKIKSGKVIVNAGFGFKIEMIENLILNHIINQYFLDYQVLL